MTFLFKKSLAKKKKTKAKQLDVLDTKIYPNIDITDELEKSN